jgi:adenylate kinase
MNIIILGPPGSGKGTVCERLVKDFDYHLISAGDLLRNEKSSGSVLGNKIAEIIDKGNLVPDKMISNVIFQEFKKPIRLGRSYLIDGYPRTQKQSIHLDGMINVPIVLWLNVSEETTIKRNLLRGQTSGRPDDSNIEIIKKRIENYNREVRELRAFYNHIIVDIDGEGTPDEVYQSIIDTLFETVIEPKDISDII